MAARWWCSVGTTLPTQRPSLSTCHSDCAPIVVEEDATAVTEFGFVRVITEGLKVISCLFVGNEVEQSQAQ